MSRNDVIVGSCCFDEKGEELQILLRHCLISSALRRNKILLRTLIDVNDKEESFVILDFINSNTLETSSEKI